MNENPYLAPPAVLFVYGFGNPFYYSLHVAFTWEFFRRPRCELGRPIHGNYAKHLWRHSSISVVYLYRPRSIQRRPEMALNSFSSPALRGRRSSLLRCQSTMKPTTQLNLIRIEHGDS